MIFLNITGERKRSSKNRSSERKNYSRKKKAPKILPEKAKKEQRNNVIE